MPGLGDLRDCSTRLYRAPGWSRTIRPPSIVWRRIPVGLLADRGRERVQLMIELRNGKTPGRHDAVRGVCGSGPEIDTLVLDPPTNVGEPGAKVNPTLRRVE